MDMENSAVSGTEGSLCTVNSDVSLEAACALIRKAYELASDEVDSVERSC